MVVDQPTKSSIGKAPDIEALQSILKGYTIKERIESGGQANVYRASQLGTNRDVAVKVLRDGPLASERQKRRFEREVECLARITHPTIVTIFESGTAFGGEFFVMEFVDGLPIDDFVLLYDLDHQAIVKLMIVVCEGVSAAHRNGVIHRDLKPSNILVNKEGDPRILDFGLAKDTTDAVNGDDQKLSVQGNILGTLQYLSPEQASGQALLADVRTDIYALGVVLYELISRVLPYSLGMNCVKNLKTIVDCSPRPLRKSIKLCETILPFTASDVGADLEHILYKTLEKDPGNRYQSVAQLAEDLRKYLSGDAVSARSHNGIYMLRKTVRRFRLHFSVAALFILLLTTFTIVATVQWRRSARIAQVFQAGLQMGAYVKLGNVDRDAGRLNQAIGMLEKATALKQFGTEEQWLDPLVARRAYDVAYTMADFLIEAGRADESHPYVEEAVAIAEAMLEKVPGNREWLRLRGFSDLVLGKLTKTKKDYVTASQHFSRAFETFNTLSRMDPENLDLLCTVARTLGFLGRCNQMLNEFNSASENLSKAHEILETLVARDPGDTHFLVELARIEARLGYLQTRYRSTDHDRLAREFFTAALQRLDLAHHAKDAANYAHDLAVQESYIDLEMAKLQAPNSETN